VLNRAHQLGILEPLRQRLRRDVLAACVGPITAGPLVAHGVPTVQPERSRMGALVRTLTEVLPARTPRWPVAGHVLELRGHAAVVDGALRAVPPTPMALLRLLAARPGQVLPRAQLLSVMPHGARRLNMPSRRAWPGCAPRSVIPKWSRPWSSVATG
jgi:uroporphyrinogen-III synthase